MKKLRCKDLGGACDKEILGNSLEEMGENCRKHVLDLEQNGDTSHNEAKKKMRSLSPEELRTFMENCQKKFDQAEEV